MPQGRPPPGRPTSASPHVSPNIRPQRGPSPGPSQSPYPQGQRPGPPPQTSSAPNINLGFSAPIDAAGADRPNWAPKTSGSGEGPRPGHPAGPQGRVDGNPPRGSSNLPSQQGNRPPVPQGYQPNPNRPQQTPQPRPPPQQQAQRPVNNVKPAQIKPSKPNTAAPPDQSAAPSPQKVSASQATVARPGKGPKTFQEMGIPDHKDDKDCVSYICYSPQMCSIPNLHADCYVRRSLFLLDTQPQKIFCG